MYGTYDRVFDLSGRCNFGDKEVISAQDNGFTQIVILGAGNDTRLHRISPLPRHVFEIDASRTQQYKLKHLPSNHLNKDVTFIPVNFEEESWLERLKQVGGEEVLQRKTLFIWEGVTYYLTNAAIRETLSLISQFPSGSRVVFDVCKPSPIQLKFFNFALGFVGEPWLSPLDETSLQPILSDCGLQLDGNLQIAASFARHSVDPALDSKIRYPDYSAFSSPLMLAAANVVK